jgi:hypothetical protein
MVAPKGSSFPIPCKPIRHGNPLEAATKWKRELCAEEVAHITGIVERVLPGLLSD